MGPVGHEEGAVCRPGPAGRLTRQFVGELHVSAHTVQEHLTAVLEKVGVRSRRKLAATLLARRPLRRFPARGPSSDGHQPAAKWPAPAGDIHVAAEWIVPGAIVAREGVTAGKYRMGS